MQQIIDPINADLIEQELNDDTFLRTTNKAGNKVYVLNAHNAPNTMREIGRLRELSFRLGGGGSGNPLDIDEFDTMQHPYHQLIVWNPDAREIIGGYRFLHGTNVTYNLTTGEPNMPINHIFRLSDKFQKEYLPYTIEMGRAFVQPKYQSIQGGKKSLFALDNLWDGIGAVIANIPDLKYLIGKVTIYSTTEIRARKAMIHYLDHYFADKDSLLIPRQRQLITPDDLVWINQIIIGDDYKEDFKRLNKFVREQGECIPPLIHAYLDLSATLKTFGTVFDPDFGNIYDTGMMITLADIYQIKRERYIQTYLKNNICNALRNFV